MEHFSETKRLHRPHVKFSPLLAYPERYTTHSITLVFCIQRIGQSTNVSLFKPRFTSDRNNEFNEHSDSHIACINHRLDCSFCLVTVTARFCLPVIPFYPLPCRRHKFGTRSSPFSPVYCVSSIIVVIIRLSNVDIYAAILIILILTVVIVLIAILWTIECSLLADCNLIMTLSCCLVNFSMRVLGWGRSRRR